MTKVSAAESSTPDVTPADQRTTARLVSDVPRLTVELVQAEIASSIAEAKARLISAGIGAGLIVGAALVGFFALATLITATVLGLATVMNGWLAALIVVVALFVIVAVAALVGVRSIRRGLHGDGDHDDAAAAEVTSRTDEAGASPRKDASHGA